MDTHSAEPLARRRAPGVLLHRVSGSLNALLTCGAVGRAPDGALELFLSPQEASDGGMVTISMRVLLHCAACAGEAEGPCAACGARRTVEELFSAWLAVPPEVAEGTVLLPSAVLPGMVRPVSFRVRHQGVGRRR